MARIGHVTPIRNRTNSRAHLGLLTLAACLIALGIAGCAHQKAFKRGTELSEEGKYERAIAKLEEAVALAEKDGKDKTADRYREKLEEVKNEAAPYFYNQAQNAFNRTDLGQALDLIERCIAYRPGELSYPPFRKRVREAIAAAEQVRTEALALADQGKWSDATRRMKDALAQYRTMPGGDGDLRQITDRAYQHYIARAHERLNANDLEGARTEATQALLYRQSGSEANAVIKTVTDRQEAAGLIAHARTLLTQGQSEEALRLLDRAHELHPSSAELPPLLAQARQAVCDIRISQGRQAMQAGQHVTALQCFRQSRDLLAGYGGIDALITDAQSRLSQRHLATSQQHLQDGLAGSAVVHGAAALGYERHNFDARRQLNRAAESVRDEVRYTIAFLGFRAAPEQHPMASALAITALEYLAQSRPANVVLVERPDPQTVLQQRQTMPPSSAPAATLPPVDAHLVGEILETRITTETKQVGQGESTYQDGYRAEPNPDHARAAAEAHAALRNLERARETLAEAEARLARYGNAAPGDAQAQQRKSRAEADVAEARQRLVNAATKVGTTEAVLAATPVEMLVPNMVVHQFPIEEVTWTARVNCMIKMLDAATGELIIAKSVEGQHSQSDRMIAADPDRNVPEDPLELPADTILFEGATKETMDKLKQPLRDACTKHGQRFATAMQRADAAGDRTQATDNAVKYLFAYPKGAEHTDTALRHIRQYLGEEDELIDIRDLLNRNCQLPLK